MLWSHFFKICLCFESKRQSFSLNFLAKIFLKIITSIPGRPEIGGRTVPLTVNKQSVVPHAKHFKLFGSFDSSSAKSYVRIPFQFVLPNAQLGFTEIKMHIECTSIRDLCRFHFVWYSYLPGPLAFIWTNSVFELQLGLIPFCILCTKVFLSSKFRSGSFTWEEKSDV
jgi:hypothetical protein